VYTLLNKRRLLQACQRAGLSTPETWFPVAAEDLRSLSSSLRYPVLVKPRTQILFWPHAKGIVATSAEDLLVRYDGFVRHTAHAPSLLAYDPDAGRPMIQAYLPEATEGIYNLSGFVDATGELSVLRASRKVLQRPRQLGVGLCFEDAEVDPDLAAKLLLLCRQLGYHGVFEAEFIEQDGRFLLIDFNPRFYGQMAFDVARESPLPLFAYLAAARRNEQLRASVQRARRSERSRWRRVYCSRLEFGLMLRLQKLAGNMRPDDLARWNGWLERHRDDLADAILDAADKGPAVAHVAAEILRFLRHPRSSLLQLASGN
jgi:hypothetical protein